MSETYNLQYKQDLKLHITANMRKYGGSFVTALADCIVLADPSNLAKLEETFSEYIETYHPSKWGESQDD